MKSNQEMIFINRYITQVHYYLTNIIPPTLMEKRNNELTGFFSRPQFHIGGHPVWRKDQILTLEECVGKNANTGTQVIFYSEYDSEV